MDDDNVLNFVWQDRDIKFDCDPALLGCTRGEEIIDSINSVEDTKGNNGMRGSLIVSNLRVIWVSHTNNRVNLSIGYDSIASVTIKKARSKLRGNTQALCVIAKFRNSRFEFIFTSLVKNSPRLFTTTQAVLKSYESSRMFRDMKLRGSIVRDNELILLPGETVTNKIGGIWNLSSDHGNLGTFYLTNIRVVWKADLAPNFNASIPYVQIRWCTFRDNTKFGKALILETFKRAGGYVLGFRIDPPEKMAQVVREIHSLHATHIKKPNFGVKFEVESEQPSLSELIIPRTEEDIEIVDDDDDVAAVAAYYMTEDGSSAVGHAQGGGLANEGETIGVDGVSYNATWGLAVETMPKDVTLESLWRII